MAENDLKVIQKAKELAAHTLKVTSNANRYPKNIDFHLLIKCRISQWKSMKCSLKRIERISRIIKEIDLRCRRKQLRIVMNYFST